MYASMQQGFCKTKKQTDRQTNKRSPFVDKQTDKQTEFENYILDW